MPSRSLEARPSANASASSLSFGIAKTREIALDRRLL